LGITRPYYLTESPAKINRQIWFTMDIIFPRIRSSS
jgi:hypothetical protein